MVLNLKLFQTSITLLRSISGQDGERRIVVDDDLTIDFKMTEDRDVHWRSNITEGQLPYFLIWPL